MFKEIYKALNIEKHFTSFYLRKVNSVDLGHKDHYDPS